MEPTALRTRGSVPASAEPAERIRAVTQRARLLSCCGVVTVGMLLSGCTQSGGSAHPTDVPVASGSAPHDTADESGGLTNPRGQDDPQPSATDEERESELHTLLVGKEEYSDLDWQVSCSGVADGNLSVIATSASGDHNYTVVVLGTGEQLSSFTFTAGRKGEGIQARSGLTVTPGSKQGNGSLDVREGIVTSTGGGVAYGPDIATTSPTVGTTPYEIEVYCKA